MTQSTVETPGTDRNRRPLDEVEIANPRPSRVDRSQLERLSPTRQGDRRARRLEFAYAEQTASRYVRRDGTIADPVVA